MFKVNDESYLERLSPIRCAAEEPVPEVAIRLLSSNEADYCVDVISVNTPRIIHYGRMIRYSSAKQP